jgi:glutaredoxin
MNFISAIFKLENKLQAQLLGAEDVDYISARKEIERTISSNNIVIYTYGLSPFSSETLAVLDEAGLDYKKVEVGLEWFLLDKEKSILRAELLSMTGQSSLPHVFINGKYVSYNCVAFKSLVF